MATWYTLEEARDDWRDAAQLTDEQLQSYLDAAQEAVWTFGRKITLPEDTPLPLDIPAGWRQAHLLQARNTWNNYKSDPSGQLGGEPGFSFAPFPMDFHVEQLIRPKGMPRPW